MRLKNSDFNIENSNARLTGIRKLHNTGENFLTESGVYGTTENPLFLAKDVATWIDYTGRMGQLLNAVDEDEKLMHTIYASGQNREMWFLTEDGLYEVLMQSRKPIAKQFKKQVVKLKNSDFNIENSGVGFNQHPKTK